jgi:ribosomal protein S27E
MSSSYDSGATNARIDKVCPNCKSTKRVYEGDWPSQTVKCAKCKTVLGYTK